ncbi:MAG: M20/M25/M40 family metallo-hydrolase [Oscillospiraceae bacterium]|nr:M20/M25/M40 family metallo-hydrolase [Oscillospiraceae bacterium]
MIDAERLLREFETLVSFDCESCHEGRIKEYLKEKLLSLGLTVSEDDAARKLGSGADGAGNLLGRLKGKEEGTPLLFSAHMDTVAPGRGKRALRHPDGTVTSDGTTVLGADDAAGLAAILEALTVIRERDLPHPEIEVLFTAAEEPYCRGSAVFDYTALRSKTAYVLDLSGPVGTAAVRAPSILSVDIIIRGRAAHAGFAPEDGINALTAAARALAALPTGHVADDTTLNFGVIEGGTGKNIVPAEIRIRGEIRSLRHEAALEQADAVRTVFAREAGILGAAAEVTVTEEIRAYSIGEDEYPVRRFRGALAAMGLGEGALLTTFGGSDNNRFAAHGIRGIVMACAMNDVHTVHEYTQIPELERCAALTLRLMTMEETDR